MPVILVIIIAVAWIAILAPNMMKRRARARLGDGTSSISTFHHQLRILEHSAPEPLVAPAYRLLDGGGAGGADPEHGGEIPPPVLTVVGEDRLPRPALAFLGRDEDGDTTPGPPPVPMPPVMHPRRPDPAARRAVRRRRRDTLGVLAAVFVFTLLIGFIPGAGAAWMMSAISGVGLVAYTALLVRLHKLEYERSRKLRHLRGEPASDTWGAPISGWDNGADEVEVVAAGRFAHPSHPVWAAR